jgi:hypothetical protein
MKDKIDYFFYNRYLPIHHRHIRNARSMQNKSKIIDRNLFIFVTFQVFIYILCELVEYYLNNLNY